MKYAALDSACYSGKTTTINYLEQHGIPTLLEPRSQDALPADAEVRAPLPRSFEGYAAKIDALVKVESMRTDLIDRHRGSGTDLLVADRSPIATVVFEDMAVKYGYGDTDDRLRAREYAVRQLDYALRAGHIVMPECLVVMSLEDETEFYRRVEERGPIHITQLSEYGPSRFMTDTTFDYARHILGNSAAEVSITGAHSPQEVGSHILNTIYDLPANQSPRSFGAIL